MRAVLAQSLAAIAVFAAASSLASPADAQPISGLYIGAGLGVNFWGARLFKPVAWPARHPRHCKV